MLELWSLFDFLMPGFLGTEKQFYERYGKPIIQSRDAKSSSKEQEAGLGKVSVSHFVHYSVFYPELGPWGRGGGHVVCDSDRVMRSLLYANNPSY